jgi:hypothetical protein
MKPVERRYLEQTLGNHPKNAVLIAMQSKVNNKRVERTYVDHDSRGRKHPSSLYQSPVSESFARRLKRDPSIASGEDTVSQIEIAPQTSRTSNRFKVFPAKR